MIQHAIAKGGLELFSASRQTRFIAEIASTGYRPAAVSADSITASVPSSTALATSETSARVGIGLEIIDSIIWVAVITTLFCSRRYESCVSARPARPHHRLRRRDRRAPP
jgi:hypothetical protein